jgi:hypothetical protein
LTSSATDADWIAAHLNGALTDLAAAPPAELAQLPDLTAARLATEFAHEARRTPIDKTEHPSASAIVVRPAAAGSIMCPSETVHFLPKVRTGSSAWESMP